MNEKILSYIDDIDIRRSFGLRPRRLKEDRLCELNNLLSHDGIFFKLETCALYNFNNTGCYTISKPVTLDIISDGLKIFNLYQNEYTLEIYFHDGVVITYPANASWSTEMRVIIA